MTAKEKAHALLDELPESEVEPVLEFIAARSETAGEIRGAAASDELEAWEMSHVPEALRYFDDGTPQPNWAAAVRRSRLGH